MLCLSLHSLRVSTLAYEAYQRACYKLIAEINYRVRIQLGMTAIEGLSGPAGMWPGVLRNVNWIECILPDASAQLRSCPFAAGPWLRPNHRVRRMREAVRQACST